MLSELIEQLKIIYESDGDLPCFILHKTPQGDLLENSFPTVIDVTKDWMKQVKELQFYQTGQLVVIL